MTVRAWLLACALLLGAAAVANAESWPTRPIRLIVASGAGTASDVIARLTADGLTRGLSQPVIVENQAGAAGIVAHQNGARATPDGYTFMFSSSSGLATNPVSFKSLPYDPVKDFTPVANVVDIGAQMLSVNVDLPVKSFPELIAYAKAHPGELSYGVDVTAGASPVAARLLNKRADLGLIEVPYRSAAQMVQDAASGRVQVLIASLAVSRSMVEAGKLRYLAISSSKRFPILPDIPTMNETVPGVQMDGWFVLMAPVGTPADIVYRMNREMGIVLDRKDIQDRIIAFGLATTGAGTPESTAEFIAREQEKWQTLAQELNIEKQ
jgi:tripartite-type tricarboxylate transporter receptor subunit TctC